MRLTLVCLAALLLAAPAVQAATRPVGGKAPTGLRGFLLRADEPRSDVFSRTPSFGWNPVSGALRYEFQLSTSTQFREGGVLFSDEAVASPAVAVPLALPWITGSPHSLYARVRAVLRRSVTPWSRPFGFNMRWPTVPQPLAAPPGLIRWTPVEGATSYLVWYLFPNGESKQFTVYSNVADQREWYTFHRDAEYTGAVRWRIRAVRRLYGASANSLPAVSYGPWSPVYTSSNPAFATGELTLSGTISDAVSTAERPAAHGLMPAFAFAGDRAPGGAAHELWRVYVFTDRDCINTVFRGAIVGGPAYAPRPFGPLALPPDEAGIASARTTFLADGKEPVTTTYDLARVETTESAAPAAPYAPKRKTADPGTGTTPGATTTPPPATTPPVTPATTFEPPTNVGAPIDLWDTDWPRGRYYWTVIPVEARSTSSLSGRLAAAATAGSRDVVVSTGGFVVNDSVTIGAAPSLDRATIVAISGNTLSLSGPLEFSHGPGEAVTRLGGAIEYRDAELTQDACAAGRVLSFGKTSEPVVTASAAPFASGLSTKGRLTAARTRRHSFSGHPLVAWAPALGAGSYEVQWSKSSYPFRAAADSVLTHATSLTLPLAPGTWYYRVRGINYSVATGAQPMSWSQVAAIRVAKPTYRVVRTTR